MHIQGAWVHPEIDNPEYSADSELYKYESFCGIGFDLWQVKAGTIFDNILITDDVEVAKKAGDDLWKVTSVAEKEMKDKQDEEEKKKVCKRQKSMYYCVLLNAGLFFVRYPCLVVKEQI